LFRSKRSGVCLTIPRLVFAVKKTTIETFVRTGGPGILALKDFNRSF